MPLAQFKRKIRGKFNRINCNKNLIFPRIISYSNRIKFPMLHDQRVFLQQFFQQYHTTGSVLPSSRALARALCRFVGFEIRRSGGKQWWREGV